VTGSQVFRSTASSWGGFQGPTSLDHRRDRKSGQQLLLRWGRIQSARADSWLCGGEPALELSAGRTGRTVRLGKQFVQSQVFDVGILSDPTGIGAPGIPADGVTNGPGVDNRFLSPAAPLEVFGGFRVSL